MNVDPSRPHAVYRIRDDLDRLLYIGCSVNPDRRLNQHRSHFRSSWGHGELTMTKQWFPDMSTGREVETIAIKAEKPLYNTLHHPDRPKGWHMRPDRAPHREWAVVWCGPDNPPWVALDKAIAAGTLEF